MPDWPTWWEWDLELTPHLEKRMEDRGFSEVDLRDMLEPAARGLRDDVVPGRFVVETTFQGDVWEVIVEPDPEDRLLVLITAYRIDS
jgi:hypothetical protein